MAESVTSSGICVESARLWVQMPVPVRWTDVFKLLEKKNKLLEYWKNIISSGIPKVKNSNNHPRAK
jgi:hypothetical protein